MTVKVKDYRGESVYELQTVIEDYIDGSDYGLGELETLRATVQNQTKLITFIIEHLNPTDVTLSQWFGGWSGKTITKL